MLPSKPWALTAAGSRLNALKRADYGRLTATQLRSQRRRPSFASARRTHLLPCAFQQEYCSRLVVTASMTAKLTECASAFAAPVAAIPRNPANRSGLQPMHCNQRVAPCTSRCDNRQSQGASYCSRCNAIDTVPSGLGVGSLPFKFNVLESRK